MADPIEINRGSADGVLLPPAVSAEIWQDTQEQSVVMRLGRQIPMPGSGVAVPIITGDPEADWVGETEEKPVSTGTLGVKQLTPYKLAVIEPFSNEFRRDLPALYAAMIARLPGVIAKKLDQTALFGPAPGSNFDTLADAPTQELGAGADAWPSLVAAIGAVAAADGALTGWALSPAGEVSVLGTVDNTGRPLFVGSTTAEGGFGSLVMRPVVISKHVASEEGTIGFAGEWATAIWGMVSGITMTTSDQATLTTSDGTINLWQRNMTAVRIEVEFAFGVRDPNRFVQLTSSEGNG